MPILDANVLLRHFTGDHADFSPRASALLAEIQAGRRTATLPEAVVAEVVYVLSSKRLYGFPRDGVRDDLAFLIGFPGIELVNKRLYLDALDLFVEFTRMSFIDALCATYARRSDDSTVISFDRDFRNIPGVTWEQP